MASLFTYDQFTKTRWPQRVGLCATDARLLELFNEAQRRILDMPGRWVGGTQNCDIKLDGRSWFCAPPGVSTILVANNGVTGGRGDLRNQWYQFSGIAEYVPGAAPMFSQPWASGPASLFIQEDGVSPVIADQPADPFTVRCYANFSDDIGKYARIYGLLPGQELPIIGTETDGAMRPGVRLRICDPSEAPAPAVTPTPKAWETDCETPNIGVVTLIEKEATTGPVDFYGVSADGTETHIQRMESWETNSLRQRWVIRSCPLPCFIKTIVKLSHVPVTRPTDFAVLASMDGMGAAVLSLKRYEERSYPESAALWEEAIRLFDDATRNQSGDRVTIQSRGVALNTRMAGFI